MSIFPHATSLVTWKRSTAFVLDSTALAGSHAVDRQPAQECVVVVRVTGSPTGTVTVAGTVGGSPDTEVLTWTGSAGYRQTKKRFTALTTLTPSIAGGTNIEAKAAGADGNPVLALYNIKTGFPVTIMDIREGRAENRREGDGEEGDRRILVQYEDVWRPRRNDRVIDDRTGEVYVIGKVSPRAGTLYQSEWACTAVIQNDEGET